jgi:Kef-type K+ transport system membrane component KefB
MTATQMFLAQVLIVIALPYVIWRVLRLGTTLPYVVLQIIVGVSLGPSFLGRVAPDIFRGVVGSAGFDGLSGIASIAVLLFGFTTGLHFDPQHCLRREYAFAAFGSLVTSVGFGAAAGFGIAHWFPASIGPSATGTQFAMAVGICAGVTALPVLAAILREVGLVRDPIGQWALGLAAVTDGALWLLLAATLWGAETAPQPWLGTPLFTALLMPVYLVGMIYVVRPRLRRIANSLSKSASLTDGYLVCLVAMAVASGLITETLGLHFILGAFIAGAIVPIELQSRLLQQLEPASLLLMSFFFVGAGLKTEIDFSSRQFVFIFLVTTLASISGKIFGTAIPMRLSGWTWPNALSLGVFMQTKGLMEVVVLTILLDAGIISNHVFSALVLMAIVCTAVVMPLARYTMLRRSLILTGRHHETSTDEAIGAETASHRDTVAAWRIRRAE